ncbi:hypothetical protein [Mycolicibacterium sp.]|uniref:hypothetical protein n=1 Tax=Mycolicibacterium sp. TaxID=2320850 RepID=UPI001A1BA205|nr:hypothetical protein [Mycolicibacterium sp.]MBJ7341074.1 hypothetical protein [Mycolicibacterium sp.]
MLRFLLACALTTAAMSMCAPVAMADPPDCPVTNPPVINRCGWDAPPPPPPAPPPGVTVAMCQDGAFTFTQNPNYRSTCAENGGVAKWMTG